MRSVADLDARMGVLKDRATMEGGNLAAFLVPVPEGYTSEDTSAFKRVLSDALAAAIKFAEAEVEYLRMWPERRNQA
jgi:hypothetical protein